MKYKQFILAFFFSVVATYSFADTYPRNYSLDVLHYVFELKLSDKTDEIIGTTSITILFKTNDTKQIRLDFINKTEQRLDKGMIVESVTYNNTKAGFIHKSDVLLIQLPSSPEKTVQLLLLFIIKEFLQVV